MTSEPDALCCAVLEPVESEQPIAQLVTIRCICGYTSLPLPNAVAVQVRAAHERMSHRAAT